MMRKLFKTGNSLVVALPRKALEALGLREGAEVLVEVDLHQGRIVIASAAQAPVGVDAEFARQVAEFIERYRPALNALARA